MALPSFVPIQGTRKRRDLSSSSSSNAPVPSQSPSDPPSKAALRSATRVRLIFSLLTSFLFLGALIFIILVEIGNTRPSNKVLGSIYFLHLDVSHVIPQSVPKARLINSIARTLGLHDFYQVGLWNYCQGYGNEITDCSTPKRLYWFNPVEIILSELLAGATIALPSTIIDALDLVRLASHWMFGLFMAGACFCFMCIFVTPLSIYTRWATLPIVVVTFLAALTTTAATIIATAMFIIFQNVVHGAEEDVNIIASLGPRMFVFMWLAAGCAVAAWLLQLGMCCCCASRRDVIKGKKTGRKKAWRRSGEVAPAQILGRKSGILKSSKE